MTALRQLSSSSRDRITPRMTGLCGKPKLRMKQVVGGFPVLEDVPFDASERTERSEPCDPLVSGSGMGGLSAAVPGGTGDRRG